MTDDECWDDESDGYYEEEEDINMNQLMPEEECEDFEDALAKMHAFNYTGFDKDGVLYSFVLRHEVPNEPLALDHSAECNDADGHLKGLVFYPRSQNCYGELRKYENIHDDCVLPEDRPDDLYAPFPKTGTPVALGFSFANQWRQGYNSPIEGPNHQYHEFERMVLLLFSDESPWIKGFGGSKFIEWTYDQDKRIRGVVIKTADLDPTVLVNLMKNLQQCNYGEMKSAIVFNKLIDSGLSLAEASFVFISICEGWSGYISQTDQYINPSVVSFKRMAAKDPHILSRGVNGTSFKDRSDYSRYFMHMPFGVFAAPKDPKTGVDLSEWYNPEEKGISLAKELAARGVYTMNLNKIIPIIRELTKEVSPEGEQSSFVMREIING